MLKIAAISSTYYSIENAMFTEINGNYFFSHKFAKLKIFIINYFKKHQLPLYLNLRSKCYWVRINLG